MDERKSYLIILELSRGTFERTRDRSAQVNGGASPEGTRGHVRATTAARIGSLRVQLAGLARKALMAFDHRKSSGDEAT
jgi:hypothetical protein